jgi:DNA-binding NtrC family response regulator
VVGRLALLLQQYPAERITRSVLESALAGDQVALNPDRGSEIVVNVPGPGERVDIHRLVREVEQRLVHAVLAQEQGNVSRSARRLGLSRQGLRNKIDAHNGSDIDSPEEVDASGE